MFVIVTPAKIQLPPGAIVRLPGSWQDYKALSQKLGDRLPGSTDRHRAIPRIKYRPGEILLMSPLPKHGRQAHLLAHVITLLLDRGEQDYEAFTPVTMELPEVGGIEPDYCFYIDSWAAVAGKSRINWAVDPAPDLVVEIEVTSYTDINDYLPYRVPEVWLFKTNQVVIYSLQNQAYILQDNSRYFPNLDVGAIALESWKIACDRNTSVAICQLRQKLAGKH